MDDLLILVWMPIFAPIVVWVARAVRKKYDQPFTSFFGETAIYMLFAAGVGLLINIVLAMVLFPSVLNSDSGIFLPIIFVTVGVFAPAYLIQLAIAYVCSPILLRKLGRSDYVRSKTETIVILGVVLVVVYMFRDSVSMLWDLVSAKVHF